MDDKIAKGLVAKALTSVVGRVLLAGFAVVIVPIEPQLIHLAADIFGYDLTDAQVQAYANRAILGIAALAGVWLANHGLWVRNIVFKYGHLLDSRRASIEAVAMKKPAVEDVDPHTVPPVLENESSSIGDSAGRPPLTEITRP